jgi:hypothetical protein
MIVEVFVAKVETENDCRSVCGESWSGKILKPFSRKTSKNSFKIHKILLKIVV